VLLARTEDVFPAPDLRQHRISLFQKRIAHRIGRNGARQEGPRTRYLKHAMGKNPTSHKAPVDLDPDAVFAALDKVVAKTPLAARHQTGDAMAEPMVEEAAPPQTGPARPTRVSEIVGEPWEIASPERAPETLTLKPVPNVASPKPTIDDSAPESASEALRELSAKSTPAGGFERLAAARHVSARRGPVPAAAASAQPSTPLIAETATDVDQPVEVPEMIPATPRRRSPVGVALVLLIIVASVQAVFLVRGLRERVPVSAVVPVSGTVAVESTPAGATILINGQERGKTPATFTLDPGEYTMAITSGNVSRRVPLSVRAGTSNTEHFQFAEAAGPGALTVSSQPSGARVTIDGSPRGVTPLTISGLQPGSHAVQVEGPSGSTRENVTLQSGATASLTVTLPSAAGATGGWLSVAAPIDVQLFEAGVLLGSSQSPRIMLQAGRHVIEAINTTLGYQTTHTVQIGEGAVARLGLDMPAGILNVNAVPWAEVSIDGKSLGLTPLGNVSVPIGTHEVVFKHPQLGERRQTAIVTLKGPNRVSVNLNQP
jgi:hypothetical protein